MRIKKILSLAVVLAMVMAVVPMFGLTASAAEAKNYTSDQLVQFATEQAESGKGYVFDGTRAGAGKIEGEAGGTNHTDYIIGKITAPEVWTGWTSSWDDVDGKNYGENADMGAGTNVNMQTGDSANYIQFYGPKVDSIDNFATVTANEAVVSGTSNKDFIVLEWVLAGTGSSEYDFGLYTSDDTLFDTFRYFGSEVGPFYADNRGGQNDYNSGQKLNSLTYTDDASTIWTNVNGYEKIRIVYENKDAGYTATYYGMKNGAYEKVVTKTFATGKVSNLGKIKAGHTNNGDTAWSNNQQLKELKIYAGMYPESSTEATIKAALDSIEVTSMTKGQAISLATTTTDSLQTKIDNIIWKSSNADVIKDDGTVTQTDKVETVTLTPSATVEGIGDGPITGNPHTVTVFPKTLAGTEYSTGDAVYTVGDAVITLDDITDATSDAKKLSESDGWDENVIGDVTYYSSNSRGGSTDKGSAKAQFTVENNTDYLATITYENGMNAKIKDQYSWSDGTVYVDFPDTIEWDRKIVIFNSGDKTTLHLIFCWLRERAITSVQDFAVYKITKKAETLESLETPDDVGLATGRDVTEVLPETVEGNFSEGSKRDVVIEWETSDFDNTIESGHEVRQITGKAQDQPEITTTINVDVYHDWSYGQTKANDFGVGDNNTIGADAQAKARKNAIMFPAAATDKLTAEFDVVFNNFGDYWIQLADINATGNLFTDGGQQIGIGFNAAGGFRPVNGDGSNGRTESDQTYATLTANKTYSMFVKVDVSNHKYSIALFDKETGEQLAKKENFGFRSNRDELNAMYVFSNGSGENAFSVSNVELTYAEVDFPETYDVTANYYTSLDEPLGDPNYTVKRTAKPNSVLTFEAVSGIFVDGAYYKAGEKQITFDSTKTENILLEKDTNMPVADKMFDYNFHSNSQEEKISGKDNGYPIRTSGTNRAVPIIIFTAPDTTDGQKLANVKLHVYTTAEDNTNSKKTEVYVLTGDQVNTETPAMTAGDYTIDDWKDRTGAVLVGSYVPKPKASQEAVLDLSKVEIGEKLILALCETTSNNWHYIAGADSNNPPYLSDITTADAPVGTVDAPTLGWDGKGFTINYSGTSGQTLLIYHENPVTGALMPADTKAIGEENTGVAVSTPNTNRIYAAAVYDKVAGEMSAKASIYSLVVDEVLNGYTAIDPDKLAKVNEVIANGGVYYSDELATDNLTDETKKIMSVTAENEVTINSELVKLNIGFTYNGGKLFVGTSDITAGEAEGTFSTLKIEDGAVTLSGKIENGEVTGQEAVTLSLDAVNIEFIETLIEEAQADGVDADVVLTPEI